MTGTGLLLRFALRRDRVRLIVWTASIVLLWLYVVGAFTSLFDTAESRQARAALMSTPASILLTGPGYGLDDYTIGAMVANEMLLWIILSLAIMSILQVVRHTRAEEESSRSELVRAGVVGRHAPAVAAMLLVLIVNLVIAALSAAVLAAGGLDPRDSVVIALAAALTALVFAGVASVTCQLTAHGRGASGLAIAVLGVAIAVRGVGDIQRAHGSALSWLSPVAWAQQTRVFVDTRLWPLGLSLVLTVVLLVLAATLASRRDFGAAMLPERRGRADAVASLASPFALAWRQQRVALAWWTLGTTLMWLASGTYVDEIGPMVGDLAETNPAVAQILGGDGGQALTDGFVSVFMLYAALIAVGYGISAVLRARTEETEGLAEYALATAVSRGRWLGAQLAVAGIGAAVLTVAGGVGVAIGAYSVGATDPSFGAYLVASAAYLPAVAVVIALSAALFAWLPRLAGLPWAILVLAFVVGMFGEALDLPDAVQGLSPLWWVPRVPAEDFAWAPTLVLTAIAAALFGLAFWGFRRRDVPVV
ncbi:exporter of polyketide antibiotics [Xylanimonas ulmi]